MVFLVGSIFKDLMSHFQGYAKVSDSDEIEHHLYFTRSYYSWKISSVFCLPMIWQRQHKINGEICLHKLFNIFFFKSHCSTFGVFERLYLKKFKSDSSSKFFYFSYSTVKYGSNNNFIQNWPILFIQIQIKLKNACKINFMILFRVHPGNNWNVWVDNEILHIIEWFVAKRKFIPVEIFFQTRNQFLP